MQARESQERASWCGLYRVRVRYCVVLRARNAMTRTLRNIFNQLTLAREAAGVRADPCTVLLCVNVQGNAQLLASMAFAVARGRQAGGTGTYSSTWTWTRWESGLGFLLPTHVLAKGILLLVRDRQMKNM